MIGFLPYSNSIKQTTDCISTFQHNSSNPARDSYLPKLYSFLVGRIDVTSVYYQKTQWWWLLRKRRLWASPIEKTPRSLLQTFCCHASRTYDEEPQYYELMIHARSSESSYLAWKRKVVLGTDCPSKNCFSVFFAFFLWDVSVELRPLILVWQPGKRGVRIERLSDNPSRTSKCMSARFWKRN